MAGGGGSTGGIGAQSPAVNPPSPMGQVGSQIGNAVGNAFGGMGQQPIPQDLSSMGGNVDTGMNYTPGMQQTGYNPNLAAMFGGPNGQQYPNMMGGNGFTPGFGQQQQMQGLIQQMDAYMQGAPAYAQLQDLQKQIQSGQLTPEAGQAQAEALNAQLRDYQQKAPMMPQIQAMQQAQAQAQAQLDSQGRMGQQPAGLMALLGGQPRPAPAMAPNPGKPAPTATKPVAKPTVVPPKTPPAVASAIQKLAMKNPMGRR